MFNIQLKNNMLENVTDFNAEPSRVGRKHTPETKEKMRAAKLGRKLSPETKEKIRAAQLGRKLSPEHVEKMRLLRLGRKHTPETIEKMRLAKARQTPEFRYKVSQAHLIKGPQHPLGNVCDFRSPTNVVWHVSNINYFVRTHKHLFDKSDVMWKNSGHSLRCRASAGLGSLCRRTKTLGSWKGWTLVSDVERFKNAGNDLLGRVTPQEER